MIRSLLLGAVAAFQVENIILDKQLGERSFNDRFVHEFIRVSPLSGARDLSLIKLLCFFYQRGCIFPMVIWPAFRKGQYRVNDHPYHAPQFIKSVVGRHTVRIRG